MAEQKPRLKTLEEIEQRMQPLADGWNDRQSSFTLGSGIARDFADSLSLLARELRALREQRH